MPKKTLRQKIHADVRHKEFTFIAPATTTHTIPQNRLVYHDIRKTVIIGTMFIAVEISLYFLTNRLGW